MKLVVLTIVKDGMPWITLHYPELRRLTIDWEWHVVEGTANAEHCTTWCRKTPPGLSTDGTTEYLDSLNFDGRVIVYRSEMWHGKVNMVNEPLRHITEPCVLLQADADELWKAKQLDTIYSIISNGKFDAARFHCRYYLGPDIAITSRNTFGNRTETEWFRAWLYRPGARFKSHEPHVLDTPSERTMNHRQSEKHGLVFDHMAYATERQVAFKRDFYGSASNPIGHLYSDAVDGWRRLQDNQTWPARVRDFLRFVKDDATAERIR